MRQLNKTSTSSRKTNMALTAYHQTLERFGLEKMKHGLDLQVTKGGDIAVTRDGDLQFGNTQQNALFRLVERWRGSESTISELFGPMLRAAQKLDELSGARARDQGPSLSREPQAYHEVTDAIVEAQLVSSTLAGSIAVIVHSLLVRFKLDLNASKADWHASPPQTAGFSLGEVFTAAAANFRHYDEWAAAKKALTDQQLESMTVLCGVLGLPVLNQHGHPSIRDNVCGAVTMKVTGGSADALHDMIFAYAKALARFS